MGTTSEQLKKALDELTPLSKEERPLDLFEDVELDESETKEALRLAREKKYYKLKRIQYLESLNGRKTFLRYTAEQLMIFLSQSLTVDDDNRNIINQLCKYFSHDPSFAGDLNKGLFMAGGVGVGKTTLMRFFMKNQVQSYRMESCREIESKFSSDGDQFVYYCSWMIPIATNSDPFGHQSVGICFDDLGTEANAKHYGKEKNVLAEIILNRYDNKLP